MAALLNSCDMRTAADYRPIRAGSWIFWSLSGVVDAGMLESVAAIAERQPYSKHPQTVTFAWPPQKAANQFFLKVFHRRCGAAQLKDLWRQTTARRFWRQGLALSAAGFNVPVTVMFGEKRRWGQAEMSLVLTEKIDGQPAPVFLSALRYCRDDPAQVKMKRRALGQFGELVRRFHDAGFVHGDLVASNIFVAGQTEDAPVFYFMDNDRTQRYPVWLAAHLRKRNLVQLNRLPLAHVTLQDRMRFLHAYLKADRFGNRQRELAAWLERKTRQRRCEVDGVATPVSFRQLMAWHDATGLSHRR